jgi:anaerobic selenocysteine-containing dehydrogenase
MRTAENSSLHYRACNLCEAICGIEITVQDPLREPSNEKTGQRLDIRGDKDDPFSQGYICPKAAALRDLHYDRWG